MSNPLDLHGKFVSSTFERLVQFSDGFFYDASGNRIPVRLNQDTFSGFFSSNPILALGEFAFETDTLKFKIGDGTTDYNTLPYIGFGSTGASGYSGYSGVSGYSGYSGFAGASTGVLVYFNQSVSSDIPTYKEVSRDFDQQTQSTIATVIPGHGTAPIASFATPLGYPNVPSIQGGIWDFNVFASVSNTSNDTLFYAEIYKRSSGGLETLLATTPQTVVDSLTVLQYILTVFVPTTSLDLSDRIVIKMIGVNTTGSAKTLTTYYEGNINISHLHTSFTSAGISGFSGFSGSGGGNIANAMAITSLRI